jgi:hypothetical protein
MKVKDWNVFCDTIGKQLNFIIGLGILAVIDFLISAYLENFGFPLLASNLIKGSMVFLAAYFFAYAIILTKKILDKQYKQIFKSIGLI